MALKLLQLHNISDQYQEEQLSSFIYQSCISINHYVAFGTFILDQQSFLMFVESIFRSWKNCIYAKNIAIVSNIYFDILTNQISLSSKKN